MSKKRDDFVFSYDSEKGVAKHFFDKKGNFIGNTNKTGDGYIRVQLDRKGRGGKAVSIIWGFDENANPSVICGDLKKKAGCGGTIKEGKIEIQGDKIALIIEYLEANGFKVKRVGG